MDTITPADLAMFHQAREQFQRTAQQAQQAQQAFAQAQQVHVEAVGAVKFVVQTIEARLPPGAAVNWETGAVVVNGQAPARRDEASGADRQLGLDNHSDDSGSKVLQDS